MIPTYPLLVYMEQNPLGGRMHRAGLCRLYLSHRKFHYLHWLWALGTVITSGNMMGKNNAWKYLGLLFHGLRIYTW